MLDQEAINEFIGECLELSERISGDLAKLESDTSNSSIVDALYRDIHTIKGSAHLFGYKQIGLISQCLEACLDPIRNSHLTLEPLLIDYLYKGLDIVTNQLYSVRDSGKEQDYSDEITKIVPRMSSYTTARLDQWCIVTHDPMHYADHLAPRKENPSPKNTRSQPKPAEEPAEKSAGKPHSAPEPDPPVKSARPESNNQAREVEPMQKEKDEPKKSDAASPEAGTIRVPVNLLDMIMSHIGELVLVRNQVLQYTNHMEESEFLRLSQRLNVITSELQDDVMKTRMQPIGNIFNKFSRVVRDLSRQLGKKIDLIVSGAETELDKSLIESVKDPLTHIIRNCVDHGIELPSDRAAVGKSESGTINIKAYHEGGQVIIEIIDDGKGLSRTRIGEKAVEKGLLSADELANLADQEVLNLIFSPGFSTASKVSNISGRGVGMDVVKTNVEQIGGFVDLDSTEGHGTSITIKIPLTLAIVPAIIICCSGERFAIPQVKVVELIRADDPETNAKNIAIELLQGAPVIRLRGDLIPLVDLSQSLGIDQNGHQRSESNIVILNSDGRLFGLVVDSIEDSADIVVKPLASFLKKISMYSGATILGDGSVILILDVMGVAGSIQVQNGRNQAESSGSESTAYTDMGNRSDYLIIDVQSRGDYSIPLCQVNRLEDIDNARIEYSGNQEIVKYRESVLPIINLDDFLVGDLEETSDSKENHQIVVVKKSELLFGIRVNGIVDVVQIEGDIDYQFSRDNLIGTVVMDDRIVNVVDVYGAIDDYLEKHGIPNGNRDSSNAGPALSAAERASSTVLVIDDFNFFRNHICNILTRAGYKTEKAENGLDGLSKLEAHWGSIDLVVSDIEMPVMDGFGFIKKVRSSEQFQSVPVVALTSKFNNEMVKKGKESGFDLYTEKIDADRLIKHVDQIISSKKSNKQGAA